LHRYADQQGIERVREVGYSFGALRASASAGHADYEVGRMVNIEPVIKKRWLGRLGLDFAATAKELQRYVKASDMLTFEEARHDSVGAMAYNRGLMRLTNIAIARMLAHDKLEACLQAGLTHQPNMKASLAWGSESELAVDGLMNFVIATLRGHHGSERVRTLRLVGQKHALANDIHLQAAIVLEGMQDAA
jgi:hypothetical protein